MNPDQEINLPSAAVQQGEPDALAQPQTLWRYALARICWGLVLTTITLNFFYLQYLLPAVGCVLIYLGLRSLRKANRWLGACHGLSVALLVLRAAILLLDATPAWWALPDSAGFWTGVLAFLLVFLLLFALWRGLKEIFRQAGQPPKTGSAGALVICWVLIFLLGLMETSIWLVTLPVLILWICLVVGVFKINGALEQAGYTITPAPVRVVGWHLGLFYLVALAAGILICLLCFSRRPVAAVPAAPQTGQTQLRQELAELGFPAELLADLPDEEVARLEGASGVEQKDIWGWNTADHLEGLDCQVFQVTLPGENTLRFYYFFQWRTPPEQRYRYLDGVELIPAHSFNSLSMEVESPRGSLLWEEDGQTLEMELTATAPQVYHDTWSLGTLTSVSSYSYCDMVFSLPKEGENLRGYVTWGVSNLREENFVTSCITYIHQLSPLSYPWADPCQAQRLGRAADGQDPFCSLGVWCDAHYTEE